MAGKIIAPGERTWLVRVYRGRDPQTGKRQYEGHTVHGTKKDAQTYLNAKLRDRDLGAAVGLRHILLGSLFDDLLKDYAINGKSHDWVEMVVRVHLRPFFGAMKAASVGTDQIRAYITGRQAEQAANSTRNGDLALLRRSFKPGTNGDSAEGIERAIYSDAGREQRAQGFFRV